MAKYADIGVRESVENIQNLVLQAFTSNGFTVQWDGALNGKADKRSKGVNILLGAAAQHHAVTFETYPGSRRRDAKTAEGWFRCLWRTAGNEERQQTIRQADRQPLLLVQTARPLTQRQERIAERNSLRCR